MKDLEVEKIVKQINSEGVGSKIESKTETNSSFHLKEHTTGKV